MIEFEKVDKEKVYSGEDHYFVLDEDKALTICTPALINWYEHVSTYSVFKYLRINVSATECFTKQKKEQGNGKFNNRKRKASNKKSNIRIDLDVKPEYKFLFDYTKIELITFIQETIHGLYK